MLMKANTIQESVTASAELTHTEVSENGMYGKDSFQASCSYEADKVTCPNQILIF